MGSYPTIHIYIYIAFFLACFLSFSLHLTVYWYSNTPVCRAFVFLERKLIRPPRTDLRVKKIQPRRAPYTYTIYAWKGQGGEGEECECEYEKGKIENSHRQLIIQQLSCSIIIRHSFLHLNSPMYQANTSHHNHCCHYS